MTKKLPCALLGICCLWTVPACFAGNNLLENGSFDHPDDPLTGWNTDYAWTKNSYYVDNKKKVTVVPMEKGRSNVCRVESLVDSGTKLETLPIPFEEGYRYRCTLKYKGPGYRVCFVGYRWKPGVKPHDNPTLPELRQAYKSKAATGPAQNWTTVTFELPGKKLTPTMKKYMKKIKYLTVFVYAIRTGYVDEVVVTRRRDSSVRFN